MKEVNIFEQIEMMAEVVDYVEENTKGLCKEMKMSLLCTISDILFGDESVETFEKCFPLIKEVNEEIGTYNG